MKTKTLKELEAENMFLLSLLNSFWTGDVPENASLDHLVLAKAGRLRLQEMSKKPVLLQKGDSIV